MSVVERSRCETSVRVSTIGMNVPRSPTAPEISEARLFLRRRWRSGRRGAVVKGALWWPSSSSIVVVNQRGSLVRIYQII